MRIGGWESAIRGALGEKAAYVIEALTSILASVMGGYHTEHTFDDKHSTIHASGSIFERGRTTTALGDPYTVPFTPGHFTGFGAQTWTVVAGNVTTWAYTLMGSTMTLWFDLRTTTVGGTPSAGLLIKIPDGWYAALTVTNEIRIVDNGVLAAGFIQTTIKANQLTVFRNDAANWAASVNATSVQGMISFPVRTA